MKAWLYSFINALISSFIHSFIHQIKDFNVLAFNHPISSRLKTCWCQSQNCLSRITERNESMNNSINQSINPYINKEMNKWTKIGKWTNPIFNKSNWWLNSMCSAVNREWLFISKSKFDCLHKYLCHLIHLISSVKSITVNILNIYSFMFFLMK
jgi:hypothetical protein